MVRGGHAGHSWLRGRVPGHLAQSVVHNDHDLRGPGHSTYSGRCLLRLSDYRKQCSCVIDHIGEYMNKRVNECLRELYKLMLKIMKKKRKTLLKKRYRLRAKSRFHGGELYIMRYFHVIHCQLGALCSSASPCIFPFSTFGGNSSQHTVSSTNFTARSDEGQQ